jgi:mRNA-degrading endonuclease RelE of RelBE toxin-antitoxin system
MKLTFTKTFIKAYRKLPPHIQEHSDKQLELLLSNPNHPSLNIKKMNDPRNIWEARITYSYRFTFNIKDDTYILRHIGTHDILKKP